MAHLAQAWNIGIMIGDLSSPLSQQFHDPQRRRLANVVNVPLVSDAEHQDSGAVQRLAMLVERSCYRLRNVVRHGGVDLAGEFNEAGGKVVLLRLPRKIKWINRNAVSTEPRAWIEGRKAEGFR